MNLPNLKPSNRIREFENTPEVLSAKIVHGWLYRKDLGHRDLDRDILNLNPNETKGYTSMNVLHYLGLRSEFKGILQNYSIPDGIEILRKSEQNFNQITTLLSILVNGDNEKKTEIEQVESLKTLELELKKIKLKILEIEKRINDLSIR